MRRLFAILLVATCALAHGRARAWANAQVSSARTEVRVEADGRLHVAIELDVHVMGGWLSELEIAGLDRPLVLDASVPATFARATAEPLDFQLVAEDGGLVVFRFGTTRSPRVGDYVARFAYTSTLAEDAFSAIAGDRVRYAWTFPAWAAGLDSVDLVVDAPSGATAATIEEGGFDGSARTESSGDRTRLVFHRSYLPRGVSWPVAFSLPREAVPPAMRPARADGPRVASVATSRDGRPQPLTRIVVAIFVVVALAKRLSFARAARLRDSVAVPLVPVPTWLAALLTIGFGIVAERVWRILPEAALLAFVSIIALASQRTAKRVSTARLGAFRPATRRDLRRARWDEFVAAVAPASWFDLTRVVGLVVYATIAVTVVRLHLREPADSVDSAFSIPHALVLLAVLFLVGSSAMIPMPVSARLAALHRVARSLRIPEGAGSGLGMRLALHRDVHEVAQDARLRFVSEHRAPGLVRLDVAIVERATLGGFVARPAVLVVVRQGSEAERILVRAAGATSMRTAPGGRRARVLPLCRATYALLDRLTEPSETVPDARPSRGRLTTSDVPALHA